MNKQDQATLEAEVNELVRLLRVTNTPVSQWGHLVAKLNESGIRVSDTLISPKEMAVMREQYAGIKAQKDAMAIKEGSQFRLNPNPLDPLHFYDHPGASVAGMLAVGDGGHGASAFKKLGHPRRFLNSATNEPAAPNFDSITGVTGINPNDYKANSLQHRAVVELFNQARLGPAYPQMQQQTIGDVIGQGDLVMGDTSPGLDSYLRKYKP